MKDLADNITAQKDKSYERDQTKKAEALKTYIAQTGAKVSEIYMSSKTQKEFSDRMTPLLEEIREKNNAPPELVQLILNTTQQYTTKKRQEQQDVNAKQDRNTLLVNEEKQAQQQAWLGNEMLNPKKNIGSFVTPSPETQISLQNYKQGIENQKDSKVLRDLQISNAKRVNQKGKDEDAVDEYSGARNRLLPTNKKVLPENSERDFRLVERRNDATQDMKQKLLDGLTNTQLTIKNKRDAATKVANEDRKRANEKSFWDNEKTKADIAKIQAESGGVPTLKGYNKVRKELILALVKNNMGEPLEDEDLMMVDKLSQQLSGYSPKAKSQTPGNPGGGVDSSEVGNLMNSFIAKTKKVLNSDPSPTATTPITPRAGFSQEKQPANSLLGKDDNSTMLKKVIAKGVQGVTATEEKWRGKPVGIKNTKLMVKENGKWRYMRKAEIKQYKGK